MHARRKDSMEYEGLHNGSQGEGPRLHWLARLIGYVATAFLVACANTSLVGIASGARLSFPAYMSFAGSPDAGVWLPSQVFLTIQSWTLRQTHPRAPPVQVAPVSRFVVGDAHRLLADNCAVLKREA